MPNIIIFGDSITQGACDYEQHGRVHRLQKKFDEIYHYAEVYNCGISGDTTADLLQRIDTELHARSRSDDGKLIILFAIGINDTLTNLAHSLNTVPLPTFANNITTLLHHTKKGTNEIYFIGLTPVDETQVNPLSRDRNFAYTNETITAYNHQLQKICQENNIPFISLQEIIEKADLEDGLHPNTQGHQKIAEEVWKHFPHLSHK